MKVRPGPFLVVTHVALLAACVSCAPASPPDATEIDDVAPAHDDEDDTRIDPACTTNGCLRKVTSFGPFSRADIQPYLQAGISIDNGYRVYAIEYATDGTSGTATVTLPFDYDDEPANGWPIVANAHGTIGLDDPCRLSGTLGGTGLAGLFGARGAIGAAPDYAGLGTPGLQKYLDTRSEGSSTLDVIRAALRLAKREGVRTNGRAAVVGLSQGGHASLSAAALHHDYAPELDIRAFAACAPGNAYEEQWRDGISVDGPHMQNIAMLAYSWADVAGVDDHDVWASSFVDVVDSAMHERCVWSPRFGDEPLLGAIVSSHAQDVFSQAFIDAYASGTWGAFSFMGDAFARNRIVPFTQTAPVAIWQGTDDTVVPPAMTETLVDDLRAGGMDVALTEVPGGTHLTTAFGFLASAEAATADSIAWVQARLAE